MQRDRKADTLCHTLANVRAKALVDDLADTLAEVEVEALSDSVRSERRNTSRCSG